MTLLEGLTIVIHMARGLLYNGVHINYRDVRVTGIYISLGCEYNRNVCIRDCMYYRGVHITGVAVLPG